MFKEFIHWFFTLRGGKATKFGDLFFRSVFVLALAVYLALFITAYLTATPVSLTTVIVFLVVVITNSVILFSGFMLDKQGDLLDEVMGALMQSDIERQNMAMFIHDMSHTLNTYKTGEERLKKQIEQSTKREVEELNIDIRFREYDSGTVGS
jgi:hypothetical protein